MAGVVPSTAPGALLVGETADGTTDEDVVDSITTLSSRLGLHIPGHVVPVAVTKLFQPVQQLDKLLGAPGVAEGGEVSIVHEPGNNQVSE